MKPRTVLVLAVLVAVLGALIWFVERDLPSSEERAELSKKLLPFETDEILGVSARWAGRAVRLERRSGDEGGDESTWWVAEPLEARADPTQVNRLLRALTELQKKRTIDDAEPAAVGLDAPRGRITIETEEGAWTLRIGAPVPTSDDLLVALDAVGPEPAGAGGDTIEAHVTAASFTEQIDREPGAWRDRDLFAEARNAVERLTLRGAETENGEAVAPVVLVRREEGGFWIEEPIADRADPDRVDDLLSELIGLKVDRFVDDPAAEAGETGSGRAEDAPEALGLEPPRAVLEAGLTGGDTFRLELGRPAADPGDEEGSGPGPDGAQTLYARAGGQVVTVATSLVPALTRPADAWRSPEWTALRTSRVESLAATRVPQGEGFTLERDGAEWLRDGESIPYSAASDLLSAVTEARGEAAPGADPDEADAEPLLTLRLTPSPASGSTATEGEPVTLTLIPAPDGPHAWGRSSERETVVRLSEETVTGVLEAVTAVQQAEEIQEAEEGDAEADAAPVSDPS